MNSGFRSSLGAVFFIGDLSAQSKVLELYLCYLPQSTPREYTSIFLYFRRIERCSKTYFSNEQF